MRNVDSVAQFVDQTASYHENMLRSDFGQRVVDQRTQFREKLGISPNQLAVIFGEQAYGLNEGTKVLGKRFAAQAARRLAPNIVGIELSANLDTLGSESGLTRMSLPNPQSESGQLYLNVMPGWKKQKSRPTASVAAPKLSHVELMGRTVTSIYGGAKGNEMQRLYWDAYSTNADDYAAAQNAILYGLEDRVGLGVGTYRVTEEVVDSAIVHSDAILFLADIWPDISSVAQRHCIDGVRVPGPDEVPFFLYHNNGRSEGNTCTDRMYGVFDSSGPRDLDSGMTMRCSGCGEEHHLRLGDVREEGRTATLRAMPRVFSYAWFVADGHITGGGSIYNDVVENTAAEMGLPYFPLMAMSKTDIMGNKAGFVQYQSAPVARLSITDLDTSTHLAAAEFVRSGKVSLLDLMLSVGVTNLAEVLEDTLSRGDVTPFTRVVVAPEYTLVNKHEVDL